MLALAFAPGAHAAVRAGAAEVDASWHVGASAGQYASDGSFVSDHGVDPNSHSYRRASSYGRQSELKVRAIVVQGADGRKVAVVKNDLYLPSDLLHRRTAQLLEAGDSGVTRETLTMAVTHNHSSPYYSSPSAGVWTFQDVFDVRFYDYYARKQAEAVEKAAASMVPVRVGASVNQFDKTHRHTFGPATADDGTPAGYPQSDTDHDMIVVRFDDISDPANPKPLANLVNFPLHPEFLDGNDLITADYLAPLQRMADRRTRALTILTQDSVGTAEPERSTYHSMHERLEFSHKEYAQAEYAARLMADSIIDAWSDVGRGDASQSGDPDRFVRFATDFPVAMKDKWYPGPFSHPYPGVSNCRTDRARGRPAVPVVGLPDCASPGDNPCSTAPENPLAGPTRASTPTPSSGWACPCPRTTRRPPTGRSRRTSTSTCRRSGWGRSCSRSAPASSGRTRAQHQDPHRHGRRQPVQRLRLGGRRRGPQPPTHREGGAHAGAGEQPRQRLERPRERGAARVRAHRPAPDQGQLHPRRRRALGRAGLPLTVAIGMANDYNGYIASYREYQRGDHYRKALTAWGPHSADYLATRLVTLGGPSRTRTTRCRATSSRRTTRRRQNRRRQRVQRRARGDVRRPWGRRLSPRTRPSCPTTAGRPGAVRSPRTRSASGRRCSPGTAARTSPTAPTCACSAGSPAAGRTTPTARASCRSR